MARAQTAQKRTSSNSIKLTPIKLSAIDLKYTSLEPTWPEGFTFEEPGPKARYTYDGELTRGLNWLNYACSGSEFRGFMEDYIKIKRPETAKQDLLTLKKVSEKFLNGTICRMARMAVQGFPFTEKHTTKIWDSIVEGVELSKGLQKQEQAQRELKEAAKVVKANQPTIQERILDQVRNYLGEYVDAAIDDIAFTGETKIRPSLLSQGFGEPHYKKIIELVQRELEEYKLVLKVKQDKTLKDDDSEQIREGYQHMSIKTVKALIAYIDEVCTTAQRGIIEKKASRVRKKKPIDRNKLVSKFKYLKEDTELGVKSVTLVDCLGATDVWVYNAKTRKLGVYKGTYSNCLGIKGNSWVGHGEGASVQKTLRKPKEQLAEFMKLGKNQLRKWFDGVKSVEHKLNGRGNEYTLVLRIA